MNDQAFQLVEHPMLHTFSNFCNMMNFIPLSKIREEIRKHHEDLTDELKCMLVQDADFRLLEHRQALSAMGIAFL